MEYVELVIKIPKEAYNAVKIYRTLPAEMKELGLEAIRNGRKCETITDFADRCRECGAKYGKLLKQKTGHWIRWYEEKETSYGTEHTPHCKCSECGTEFDPYSSRFIKFCNECGAKMQEVEE